MKHWISLVNVPEVEQYVEIARFAEEVGFYGITIADHLVMPTNITESKYPYTPDGKMWWPEETPWPDPWITLTAMGVATKNLRLATNIYLAAMRDPFTSASAISTASVFTGGRVVCGVSSGWIKEEYEMLGVDFHTRGR
ncbi:MAG: LLM class flavin-dependent oxidoreductase, partial [Deltaproteobacteria bacterium]|nr:LLM class flavin-dependent oxidoreductase [Deltaproteobacteria bacterium]